MDIKFWKFWTITILILFALVTGQIYFGLFDFILTYDQTYFTLVNLAILAWSHFTMAKMHITHCYSVDEHAMLRYLGDTAIAIGLMGTLVGFMIVLWSIFGPGIVIDPTNIVSMTLAMTAMAQGMSAALITSLSGLLVSSLIHLQLVVLEE